VLLPVLLLSKQQLLYLQQHHCTGLSTRVLQQRKAQLRTPTTAVAIKFFIFARSHDSNLGGAAAPCESRLPAFIAWISGNTLG